MSYQIERPHAGHVRYKPGAVLRRCPIYCSSEPSLHVSPRRVWLVRFSLTAPMHKFFISTAIPWDTRLQM